MDDELFREWENCFKELALGYGFKSLRKDEDGLIKKFNKKEEGLGTLYYRKDYLEKRIKCLSQNPQVLKDSLEYYVLGVAGQTIAQAEGRELSKDMDGIGQVNILAYKRFKVSPERICQLNAANLAVYALNVFKNDLDFFGGQAQATLDINYGDLLDKETKEKIIELGKEILNNSLN